MACKGCGSGKGSRGTRKVAQPEYSPDVVEKYTSEGKSVLYVSASTNVPKRLQTSAKLRRLGLCPNRLYVIESRDAVVDNRIVWFIMNHPYYKKLLDIGKMTAIEAKASPVEPARVYNKAKSLAEEKGIDLSKVAGTGKNGAITLSDVKAVL